MNTQLSLNEESNPPDQVHYITDTMCGPLGACLRRMGISVIPGISDKDVIEKLEKQPDAKILTSGKACKKVGLEWNLLIYL